MSATTVVPAEFSAPQSNNNLPLNQQDLTLMTERRKLIKDFVANHLRQGSDSDGDYAVIQGTKKPSLLKPGAEKLMQLFGLGSRVSMVMKEIDHNGNFAMFVYNAEVFRLKCGTVIANCEGSANSKEKKWATRTEYTKKGNVTEKKQVEAPIYDNLNTLMKMAQKRAVVGAVIQATGASDFFTVDIDDDQDAEQAGLKASVKDENKDMPAFKKLWAGGNTIAHKETLKEMGGKWDMNEKAWRFENVSEEFEAKLKALSGIELKY